MDGKKDQWTLSGKVERESLDYATTHPNSTEVELLTRSVSVAGPSVMKLLAMTGEPSPIQAQGHDGSPLNLPPLKREDGAGRLPWPVALLRN